ncbi:hypothetical protein ACIA8O_38690 [Kitasatospora sp. NPDC051853]|uniref:hypothetical protein n=1 Tax=Kitasatospora sp. NPDC051853 TaxID=3364058 RepID=UPI0037922270
MSDTITPTTSTDTTETPDEAEAPEPAAEVPLHPDFTMPVYDQSLGSWAALDKWDADLRAQAYAAYPDPEQWLERACYPGPVPTVPLAEHDGSLMPEHIAAHRRALSRRAWNIWPPEKRA